MLDKFRIKKKHRFLNIYFWPVLRSEMDRRMGWPRKHIASFIQNENEKKKEGLILRSIFHRISATNFLYKGSGMLPLLVQFNKLVSRFAPKFLCPKWNPLPPPPPPSTRLSTSISILRRPPPTILRRITLFTVHSKKIRSLHE